MNCMSEILYWSVNVPGRNYWEYVHNVKTKYIWDYLRRSAKTMREVIERGLTGDWRITRATQSRRKASTYYIKAKGYKDNLRSRVSILHVPRSQ